MPAITVTAINEAKAKARQAKQELKEAEAKANELNKEIEALQAEAELQRSLDELEEKQRQQKILASMPVLTPEQIEAKRKFEELQASYEIAVNLLGIAERDLIASTKAVETAQTKYDDAKKYADNLKKQVNGFKK